MIEIFLKPGEMAAVAEPARLRTILGSCVAVAILDEAGRIAGLNHFLLPDSPAGLTREHFGRYGDAAVKELIRRLVALGSSPSRMQAHVIGGGTVVQALKGEFLVGELNVERARAALRAAGVRIVAEDVGGDHGRMLAFDTISHALSIRRIVLGGAR